MDSRNGKTEIVKCDRGRGRGKQSISLAIMFNDTLLHVLRRTVPINDELSENDMES
tara:strand:+ start:316 stop:483 length:168 start_codon:yes stop_codon:yes gene_type:complete